MNALLRAISAIAFLVLLAGCGTTGAAKRASHDYDAYVAADPRSVVVAPVVSPMSGQAADWLLATITEPLAERGYYVFPVFMSRDVADAAGFARGPEGMGFAEFSPERAAEIAAFFGADSVLFVTIKKWGYTTLEHGLDSRGTSEVLLDYLLTDAQGQTLWTATQGASLTRGGGNWIAQIWNLFTQPSQPEEQTQLSREVNRMAIEGKPNEMGKRTFVRPAPMLVGPYHPRYKSDRARRSRAQAR